MEDLFPLLLIIVFFAFGVVMTIWTFSRGRAILEGWAAENGYRLVSSQFRWLRRGPFFWTSSKGQIVYYVVVRTPDGRTRRGWVRCGSFFWGVMRDKAEAEWEA
jgi:hypothetical protein